MFNEELKTINEAEERAVLDMGEAEAVSEKLGKLHKGAGFYLFFTIIGFISACFVYVIAFKGSVFEIVSLLFDPPGLLESAVIALAAAAIVHSPEYGSAVTGSSSQT